MLFPAHGTPILHPSQRMGTGHNITLPAHGAVERADSETLKIKPPAGFEPGTF